MSKEVIEEEGTVEKVYKVASDTAEALEYEAKEAGMTVDEYLDDMFSDGFYVAITDAEETVVDLKYVPPWDKSATKVTPATTEGYDEQTLKVFRRLRDRFPPVTAGVDYRKIFASGGGFVVEIEDATNDHQKEAREEIRKWNRTVYQDEITRGLDPILDMVLDENYTVGCAAAEIVYSGFEEEGSFNFARWAAPVANPNKEKNDPEWTANEMTPELWKSLKGIAQLKFIDNAVGRMKAYRNKTTYKIEYWTVDEKATEEHNLKYKNEPAKKREVKKLLPWQVFWLSMERRGNQVKGKSIIETVVNATLLLEKTVRSQHTLIHRPHVNLLSI